MFSIAIPADSSGRAAAGMTDDAKKEALLKLARERPHNVHTNLQAVST